MSVTDAVVNVLVTLIGAILLWHMYKKAEGNK